MLFLNIFINVFVEAIVQEVYEGLEDAEVFGGAFVPTVGLEVTAVAAVITSVIF